MHKEARLPSGDPSKPMRGPALMALQLLEFPHGPLDQNPIKDLEGRIQRRFVVLPIILHPSAQDGIEHAGEIVESLVTTQVQTPVRIVCRIAVVALALTAGVKLIKYFPCQFFALRGRNVYPRKSNFSFG